MTFTADINTVEGLITLNNYLADKSYISGYEPSDADSALFEKFKRTPDFDNVLRWYNHINSFGQKRKAFAKANIASAAATTTNEDDVDLFGSDEEDAEAEALKAKRLAEYQAKKATKPAIIAKSSVLVDVKPWDDTTDMKELERRVREIQLDGLLWGASQLVPVGYGIMKLQISCVIEDDKVGMDLVEEQVVAIEDLVQSMDIASFNKI